MYPYFVALWCALATLMTLTLFNELLRGMLIHGKVRQDAHLRRTGAIGFLMRIEMYKRGWIHFYLIGALYNLGIALALIVAPHHPIPQQVLMVLRSWPVLEEAPGPLEIRADAIAVILLLGVQDTRRFLESIFITEFGDAKMHIGLLVAGLIHYMGIAPSVLSDPRSYADGVTSLWNSKPQFMIAGIALFVYGSFQQYRHNHMLAQQKRANNGKHVLPRGGWFDHVLCPLYTAELLIYVAFALLCEMANPIVNIVLAWVILNQTICAYYGKQWYHDKFRSDEKLPRWVLVPGVW